MCRKRKKNLEVHSPRGNSQPFIKKKSHKKDIKDHPSSNLHTYS